MRIRTLSLVAVAVLIGVVTSGGSALGATEKRGRNPYAFVAPVVGGVYGVGANGPGSYAILIDVHAVRGTAASPGGTANCTNAGAESGTYAYTGWKIAANRVAHLTASSVPSYLGSVTSDLQNSWNSWRTADSAVPAVRVKADGLVTKYTANRNYNLLWGRTGGSLATTYTWRWNDGLIESDTVFNRGYTWWRAPGEGDGCYEQAGSVYDVTNIATHEFGHSYGLDHPSGARFESMYAYGYSGETLKRSLATGDKAGVRALY